MLLKRSGFHASGCSTRSCAVADGGSPATLRVSKLRAIGNRTRSSGGGAPRAAFGKRALSHSLCVHMYIYVCIGTNSETQSQTRSSEVPANRGAGIPNTSPRWDRSLGWQITDKNPPKAIVLDVTAEINLSHPLAFEFGETSKQTEEASDLLPFYRCEYSFGFFFFSSLL